MERSAAALVFLQVTDHLAMRRIRTANLPLGFLITGTELKSVARINHPYFTHGTQRSFPAHSRCP